MRLRLPWGMLVVQGRDEDGATFVQEDTFYLRLLGQQIMAPLRSSGLASNRLLDKQEFTKSLILRSVSSLDPSVIE